MPTHQLANGLSGNLQSSITWAQQEAVDQIRHNLTQALGNLTLAEKKRYIQLQRDALAALAAVETEKERVVQTFKSEGMEQLRSRIGDRDPEAFQFQTTYREKVEKPFPWEPQPAERPRYRRRSYTEDWHYIDHVKSMSLWEAACLNFGFTYGRITESGYSLVQASKVIGPGDDRSLTAQEFIDVARELDLGGQLKRSINAILGEDGTLRRLMEVSARTLLQFDVLEAWRNRTESGLTQEMYEHLNAAIEGSGTQPEIESLGVTSGVTLVVAVPFVPWDNIIPIPLLLIRVAALGVLSYFPFRPGGALRYHPDARSAEQDFRQQLLDSHQQEDLGWFSRQLPLVGMSVFSKLITRKPRPDGMSWLAGKLYDGFHKAFPARTLDDIRFSADPKTERPVSLVQALTYRQIQRCQADLDTLAVDRSEADWQALKDAAQEIKAEILGLLLTPLPGGVMGMMRTTQLLILGSLTYAVIEGLDQAIKGDASAFANSLTDVADLIVSGRLTTTASRLQRQRVHALMQKIGNPRKIIHPGGSHRLWKPDAKPYAHDRQSLLDGRSPDAFGVFNVDGEQYVKLSQDQQVLVAKVKHDDQQLRFVLQHQRNNGYTPPIVFNPAQQTWVFDLHNVRTLSDIELLQRMLPDGSSGVPATDMETMLRSTATTRQTLDKVWRSEPAPLNLTEGVRRLQVDRLLQLMIDRFTESGYLPPHGDSAVLCVLTQLPDWPANATLSISDPQRTVIESYSKTELPSPDSHAIDIIRDDDGNYSALNAAHLPADTDEPLLSLVIALQPSTSRLGLEGHAVQTTAQRISVVRRNVSTLVGKERLTLFSALVNYAGYEKSEHLAPAHVRRFLPTKASPPQVVVTPLLKKLRDLNPPLSPANLERLLEQHPLTPRQQQAYLQHGVLPSAFLEPLENHRTALRIDAAIDGLYHPRPYNGDIDQWAREFASALVRNTLKRPFVVTEVVAGHVAKPYVSSGPEDPTVELRHYGNGVYEAYDMLNGGTIPVAASVDSFYLAIGSVLQPHERQLLGMTSATDAQGLRTRLGDYMSSQRSAAGFVSLVDGSLMQYEQTLKLPTDLAPDSQGIFQWHAQQYLPLYGSLYRIVFDKNLHKWRLAHPEKVGVDTPVLAHNGQGAWRLAKENPMTWDNHELLYRLGNHTYAFTEAESANILALTNTPPRLLRHVHSGGLAAPPLLTDTCKRLKIEQQIQQFIQALGNTPMSRIARPDLQLLVLSSLPSWPDSHAIRVVDADNRVLQQYPEGNHSNDQALLVKKTDYENARLLDTVITHDEVTQALLGELPASRDDRLFKLVKLIVEFTEKEKPQLLKSIYQRSENDGGELVRHFKVHHPQLPTSSVEAILGQATPRELKQLQQKKTPGLRLAEQARLSADDVRLNRAYEGLYSDACRNADSDRITLHLLKDVPTWPADLRIDIHQGDNSGRLLHSAGPLDGRQRRQIAKTPHGYQAYDATGTPLGQPSNLLLEVIVSTLSDSKKSTLQVTDEAGIAGLRQQILTLALSQRVEIKSLLDLKHLQPWMVPPMGGDRTFLVYPFWSQLWPFGGNRPPDLVSKVQELYPRMDNDLARQFIRSLNLSEPAALIEIERRRTEYQAMDTALSRWADTPQSADEQLHDPLGMRLASRRYIAQQLCAAWRRENRSLWLAGVLDAQFLDLQLDDGDLPPADFISGTQGFAHIDYLKIAGNHFPPTGSDFLSKFVGLRGLQLDCRLTELPTAITDMTQLTHLNLRHNDIRLTDASAQRLAAMVNLNELILDNNPNLGVPPDVSRMTNLNRLYLVNTGLTQWPIGAEALLRLEDLHLQENAITQIPEAVFTHQRTDSQRRDILLHDNPLSPNALERLEEHRRNTGVRIGGALTHRHHPAVVDGASQWLSGVPAADIPARRALWEQLKTHEGASSEDAFRVLTDLTQTYAYIEGGASRNVLTQRVWTLLQAMGESTELRNNVFLNTYGSGDCGDSVLLAFTNMELEHQIHLAKEQSRSYASDRELIGLSTGRFYLNQLDYIADKFIHDREVAGQEVDPAEVTIYFRAQLANEFKLPFQPLELLYTVEDYVTTQVLDDTRAQLRRLGQSPALQEWLLMEGFWIEYLARSHPEPFATVKDTIRYKVGLLEQEVADRQSDEYLERRQSLIDLEQSEQNRLVRQLTVATQAALQRT
ncbi:hypothetical protein JTY93_21270 [Pseudomonas hygromyciniae]|uniref:RING-type E3 ubiquitin transferase n=1 Tax=Pseudomonas hygromyciniae TaxID=2812000 RepID=A0ABX7JYF8_9PSED|nr:NEL-type E3 ubiquitin ligase domain-containing protein [Pseudomonas hygromyciniae]MBN0979320.1 hypothetical protein [Pseudomonas hygromyciniae]QSB38751.1 hypothetical protein JTY93_21270 [Pseudomonas hygromyciniae]